MMTTTTTNLPRPLLLCVAMIAAGGLVASATACGALCPRSVPCDEHDELVDYDDDGCFDRCVPHPPCDPAFACNEGDRQLTGDEGCGLGELCYDRDVCGVVVTCTGSAYTQCKGGDDCASGICDTSYCDLPFEPDGDWECRGRCEPPLLATCQDQASCHEGDRSVGISQNDCPEEGTCYLVSACSGSMWCTDA